LFGLFSRNDEGGQQQPQDFLMPVPDLAQEFLGPQQFVVGGEQVGQGTGSPGERVTVGPVLER
jgi:hypothetical protein